MPQHPESPPTLTPIQTCATCKHFCLWDRWHVDYPDGWGTCSRITTLNDPEEPGTKAVVHQQWEADGILAVAPDFGCRAYEPKEITNGTR
jgi:hypothetical protein